MRLTVLGRYGPYPRADGACSGYLLEEGETRVLLDCGAGTFSRLVSFARPESLDAALISHLHYDHCSDLFVLGYALEQTAKRPPLPVYAPDEPKQTLLPLAQKSVFSLQTIKSGDTLTIGELTIRFHAMAHPVLTLGMEIASESGKRLFYTGDTGEFDGLCALIRGADALLCDACFLDADARAHAPHLTARQAGRIARETGVKTLYLTHLWGGGDTEADVQKEVDFTHAIVVQERGQYEI